MKKAVYGDVLKALDDLRLVGNAVEHVHEACASAGIYEATREDHEYTDSNGKPIVYNSNTFKDQMHELIEDVHKARRTFQRIAVDRVGEFYEAEKSQAENLTERLDRLVNTIFPARSRQEEQHRRSRRTQPMRNRDLQAILESFDADAEVRVFDQDLEFYGDIIVVEKEDDDDDDSGIRIVAEFNI